MVSGEEIYKFLNSPLFSALITLIVGTFAYGVYKKGKRDAKRRAASVILLEIEEAEQQLTKVSLDNPLPLNAMDRVKLMPVVSWSKYKHLFTYDFDRNETDKISDFYIRCEDYDVAAAMNASIALEKAHHELQVNIQRILADYAKGHNDDLENALDDDKVKLEQQYIERRKRFLAIYTNSSETHMYTSVPLKLINDAVTALQGLESSLSLTSVGTKLKRISRHHSVFGSLVDLILGRPKLS